MWSSGAPSAPRYHQPEEVILNSEISSGHSGDAAGGSLAPATALTIDVPTQVDVLPDGQASVRYGDVRHDAAYNHLQGDNPYNFHEDCGLVSCQDVLNQFGIPVREGDVVTHAVTHGECQVDPNSSFDSGQTTSGDQAQILTDLGVPAHVEAGRSLDDLAVSVEEGHGTIVEANAGVLWNAADAYDYGAANHAVTVTGVARDPGTGEVQGFYINDSGDGKPAVFVSAAVMRTAWLDTGGQCVVTDTWPAPGSRESRGAP